MLKATRLSAILVISVVTAIWLYWHKPVCAVGQQNNQTVSNSIGMKLVLVPAGTFTMGSPQTEPNANDDERPPHEVKISKPFYMGAFEVTQSQFARVTGENPSYFSPGGAGQNEIADLDTARFPVEQLTWQEAVDFCLKLSERPAEIKAGRVYRLPTEAEWEYAGRAGTTTKYHVGDSLNSKLANFNGKLPSEGTEPGPFLGRPATVGSYPPNPFGLYDMHGNVWEWCSDWYQSNYYEKSPESDPRGAESGGDRSVRGGSWADDAENCRSAYRYNVLPVYKFHSRGFRVVMTLMSRDAESILSKAGENAESNVNKSAEAIERENVFQSDVWPFLKEYCYECHNVEEPSGEFALDALDHSSTIVTTGHRSWKKVVDKIVAGVMPPEDARQPQQDQIDSVAKWITVTLSKIDCASPPDPGHETIRRLNRVEYRNTIRDLLGIDYEKANEFPTDDVGAASGALSIPPLLMERYLSAADEISRLAIDNETRTINETAASIIFVQPDDNRSRRDASRAVLGRLAKRAFRRPVTDVELERLLRLTEQAIEQGGDFHEGIRLAMQAILVSPHFLFRIEKQAKSLEEVEPLDEFELATRMSYFLWSSMPDATLFKLAAENTLRQDLDAQITRMIADGKSNALVENFATVWLELDKLETIKPDPSRFESFDIELREAMRTETEKFFESIVREDRSILDLIDGEFTFVNERLAQHYGIDGIEGSEFHKVSLVDSQRRGLLSHASILSLTSNPTRTSPVLRGKWILTNILGAPPPAPPPGVSDLAAESETHKPKSLRQRLEIHRNNPRCAACHESMDSLGFALENFDAIGRWRTTENGASIDARGSFPNGATFSGPGALTTLLREQRKHEFAECVVRKMLGYVLGRELEYYDHCTVKKIVETLEQNEFKFSILVREIIDSVPFQKNRPDQTNK